MKKILFENGKTIDGASTFNKMQDNVENVFNGKESMGSIVVEDIACKNMFDKNSGDILKNKYLDPDGSIGNSSISSVSEYIEVKPNTYYTLNIVSYSAIYDKVVVFYDSDKNYINGIQESNKVYTYTFKTPSNTKYIRFRFPNIHLDDTQLEIGQVATNYVEHKEFSNKQEIKKETVSSAIFEKIGKTVYVSGWFIINGTSITFNAPFKPLNRMFLGVTGLNLDIQPSGYGAIDFKTDGVMTITMNTATTYCSTGFSYITTD